MAFRVAIVGIACRFPQAPDARTFWHNVRSGVDAVTPYPMRERWGKADDYYRPGVAPGLERTYCRRGGVVENVSFDPIRYGVVPKEVEEAEADQFVMLDLARAALADAGIDRSGNEKSPLSAGVIIGRTMPIGPVTIRYLDRIKLLPQLRAELQASFPALDAAELDAFARRFLEERQAGFDNSRTRNLVPGFTASRISNRLNLAGPNYILDAACASSLIAIENAIAQLAAGRCELMLAGGVHLPLTQGYWSMFTNIGALSRGEQIRPFDQAADGLLLGEGAGLVVLKPLDAALAQRDRIYAVIEGIGSCSDGRAESLLAPFSEGQVQAFRLAWQAAGLDPARARYVECHGTGMPRGDEVESQSLRHFFGNHAGRGPLALGSVKSMIGHTLGAAGIASVIKTACGLAEGVLPPSLHCGRLRSDLADHGFYVPGTAEPWPEQERLAGVSAFGFGGINAHLVLSGPPEQRGTRVAVGGGPSAVPALQPDPAVLVLARPDLAGLAAALDENDPDPGRGPCRLVVFDPTPERLAKARRIVARGNPWRGRQDIFFSPLGLLGPGTKLAFLFPGLGNQVNPDFRELALRFGLDLRQLANDRDDPLIRSSLDSVFSTHTLCHVLQSLGVVPDAIAGHSLGEWISCVSAGLIGEAELSRLIGRLLELQGGVMGRNYHLMAVWCGTGRLESLLAGIEPLAVSVDNCPGHAVICGTAEALAAAQQRLRAEGILCADMGIEAASHTPFIRPSLEPIRPLIDALALSPARIPLWSASLAGPYPTDSARIKAVIVDIMASRVRFRELIERLHGEGFRAFVQIGNAGLSGFVADTLKGRDFLTLDASSRDRTSEQMLQRVAAGLYAEGRDLDLSAFGIGTPPDAKTAATAGKPGRHTLSLDNNFVELATMPALPIPRAPMAALPQPAVAESAMGSYWQHSLDTFQQAQQQVLQALQNRFAGAAMASVASAAAPPSAAPVAEAASDVAEQVDDANEPVFRHTLAIDHDRYPELYDHELYKSHDGRPIAERTSVVPMTMMIEFAGETIERYLPGRTVCAIHKVLSYRFIEVHAPMQLEARVYRKARNLYAVVVEDRFSCLVEVAEQAPVAPAKNFAAWQLRGEEPPPFPIALEKIYADRWLFHGPKYQGVRQLGAMDRAGGFGLVANAGGKGSLLDSAFQVAGVWFCSYFEDDNVVLPLKIESIELYTSFAELRRTPGLFECRVFLQKVTPTEFIYSLELARNDQILLRVNSFCGRRFEADHRLIGIFRRPQQLSLVSNPLDDGVWVFDFSFRTHWTRVMLNKSYLTGEEIDRSEAAKTINHKNSVFRGVIAAKDALKHWLFERYQPAALFPAEIRLVHDEHGAPWALSRFEPQPLALSISHKPQIAAAIVGGHKRVGIDLEFIERHDASFETLNYDAEEIAWFDAQPPEQRGFWQTLFWTAKEAAAKCTGRGLGGVPRRFKVRDVHEVPGGWAGRVDGFRFTSRRYDEKTVISWVRAD